MDQTETSPMDVTTFRVIYSEDDDMEQKETTPMDVIERPVIHNEDDDMDDMEWYREAIEESEGMYGLEPPIPEYTQMPMDYDHEHPFVVMGGVEIDEGMVDTIQTLWDAGIKTEYCCQGDDCPSDHAYIAFASPADLAMAVSMIVDHEVSIGVHNCLRYRGTLTLGAPKQPVELPILPMGDRRVVYEYEDEGVVDVTRDDVDCVCHVVDGQIRDPWMVSWRYNPVTMSPMWIRENHERELDRFKYPWCT